MASVTRHPAWKLHSRLRCAGLLDNQLNREFICDLIGIRGRDSLTKLTREQIQFANDALERLSNEHIVAKFDAWKTAREHEQVSLEELIGGAS
ncbi:MAG: hypothetical protein HC933_00490 [Pleurocapsa sp. SU_196_0]|nr:hypothetical protein [Pleurocapsa sp. SU_196_0]